MKNNKGNSVSAKIIVYDIAKPNLISEFALVANGNYSYELKKSYPKGFLVKVSATGYTPQEKTVQPVDLTHVLTFNFVLQKEKIERLEEVVIKSKPKPFIVKKDTVVFRVDAYKDGSEQKVEDLLKKLPGIEIDNQDGSIKYRGKAIETVTIGGDNLFDSNYTIGTKNINIDLIKEIEAIDNYSENALLKGIEASDKVALNLKLKDNKTDYSGDMSLGAGIFYDDNKIPVDNTINLLGINKKLKSFSLATYNNIGINTSPFDYFNNSISTEQIKEQDYFAQQLIPNITLPSVNDNVISNINSQFFGNFNGIFNLSKRLTAKTNLYYVSDKMENNLLTQTNFNINGDEFETFDNSFFSKSPRQLRGDLDLKWNASKSSLLNYTISIRKEDVNSTNAIFSNQNNDFNLANDTDDFRVLQNLEYTKKLDKNRAIQVSVVNAIHQNDQLLDISPSTFNNQNASRDTQDNRLTKNRSELNAMMLGKKHNNKYNYAIGGVFDSETFLTTLFNENSETLTTSEISSNDSKYNYGEIFVSANYRYTWGKFNFSPSLKVRWLYQDLLNRQTEASSKVQHLSFEPSLRLLYKFNSTSFLSLNAGIERDNFSILNFYENQVLINNRITKSNLPDFSLRRIENINLGYQINDLFNQLEFSIGLNYIKIRGNYFTNSDINEFSTNITNFYLPENTTNTGLYLSFSKLIPGLKTNFKINSSYSNFNFKNIVNNSELRDNRGDVFINSLFVKTAFDLPINIENKTTFTYRANVTQNTFINRSLENSNKLIVKASKELNGSLVYDYFVPNLSNGSNQYSFLSADLSYKPENKNWSLGFSGKNLLNENRFEEFSTSDVSTSFQRFGLLNRYFLVRFYYSF